MRVNVVYRSLEYWADVVLGIYKQFDKVLLINKGRQVYFGPGDQARKYFVELGYKNLPRQTTADYLTGCSASIPTIALCFIV